MSDRPTFSPFWHRVRALKPRLRPHVQITRQHYRGKRWHVVHDPASNAFYRLSPVSHEFVSLLDGRRTVEQVWDATLTRYGDEAPTQSEVIQLISQLYSANLLAVDAAPEVEQLLRRGRERIGKKVKQQLIGLMYFRIRMFNPDRILAWLLPLVRPLLSKFGLVLWVAWIIAALVAVVPQWDRIGKDFEASTDPSNWGWILVVYIVIKLIHETGHGLICKRFGASTGAQVPEFGMMILVLVPSPYVDASAAWAFASKWRRIAVGAGGMIFELAVAAAAAFVWKATPDESLLHQLAFNAMLTASVSTVLFNANPLMRFDGYYMLSDLLEVPNLMQRSMSMLKYLAQKHLYKVRNANAPTSEPSEAIILITYGLLAMAYRVFLFFSITLYIMGQMFALGLILAVWTAAMWFVLPAGAFVHYLATSPQLSEKRPRAILTSLLILAGLVLALGVVPMPDHRRSPGVVWSDERAVVAFGADGFVSEVRKRPGDRVHKGEIIAICESTDLISKLRESEAQLEESEALERAATQHNPAGALVARERVKAFRDLVNYYRDRAARLTITAPQDGVIVGRDPALLIGSLGEEGQPFCEIVNDAPDMLRIAASLQQTEGLWVYELAPSQYRAEMRSLARVERAIPLIYDRRLEAGVHQLTHAALTYAAGGPLEADPKDQSGRTAKRPQFTVFFKAESDPSGTTATLHPGQRVSLRFTLPDKPLLAQWVDRLEKLIQGRTRV